MILSIHLHLFIKKIDKKLCYYSGLIEKMKETCKDLVICYQSCIHILDIWLFQKIVSNNKDSENEKNVWIQLFVFRSLFYSDKILTFIFTSSLLMLTKILYMSSTWCSNLSTSWLFIFKLRLDIVLSVFILVLSSASLGGRYKRYKRKTI